MDLTNYFKIAQATDSDSNGAGEGRAWIRGLPIRTSVREMNLRDAAVCRQAALRNLLLQEDLQAAACYWKLPLLACSHCTEEEALLAASF